MRSAMVMVASAFSGERHVSAETWPRPHMLRASFLVIIVIALFAVVIFIIAKHSIMCIFNHRSLTLHQNYDKNVRKSTGD